MTLSSGYSTWGRTGLTWGMTDFTWGRTQTWTEHQAEDPWVWVARFSSRKMTALPRMQRKVRKMGVDR